MTCRKCTKKAKYLILLPNDKILTQLCGIHSRKWQNNFIVRLKGIEK